MIGNARDAKLISDWAAARTQGSRALRGAGQILPEGWTFLGQGCYRAVFCSPEGVAYKVESGEYGYGQTNEDEAIRLRDLHFTCKLPEGMRLPKATYYEDSNVIAMERLGCTLRKFMNGTNWDEIRRYRRLLAAFIEESHQSDMHYNNVMIDDKTGELVPVDLS